MADHDELHELQRENIRLRRENHELRRQLQVQRSAWRRGEQLRNERERQRYVHDLKETQRKAEKAARIIIVVLLLILAGIILSALINPKPPQHAPESSVAPKNQLEFAYG